MKELNANVVVVKENFWRFFDDVKNFCTQAEKETKLEKTKNNMKADGWENYPESLLHRLYKSNKYDNGNGCLVLVYDNDKLFALSGVEKHTDNIAIISKRLFVLREYRTVPIFSMFIIKPQIEWAKKRGFKVCLITVNEYQRDTVLRIFKRAQKRGAIILGRKVYPDGNIFKEMKIYPVKMFINGEYQYIISYLIDKDYQIDLEEI